MKISAFNGSPRGVQSNSKVILNWIIEGTGQDIKQETIKAVDNHPDYVENLKTTDLIILVFRYHIMIMANG